MNGAPRCIVVRSAGTNCDGEMCRGFERAGASVELVHLDRLVAAPGLLDRSNLIGIAGGFSYGDDLGAGRVFAVKVRERLYPRLRAAAERGVPILGICNGFQILVQTGLLPGFEPGSWPVEPAPPTTALAMNTVGRLIDDWPRVEYDGSSPCIWTRGLGSEDYGEDARRLPLASGEGRFIAEPAVLDALEASGQIPVRYVDNLNGSSRSIAGVCDPSGRVFGLMPHPDRYLDWTHHPYWTRLGPETLRGDPPGLRLFRNAVSAVREGVAV
ncbi:MAG TPA: phosphoribosylformylglycinamidine synthase [Phycisphaerales bacterium]|nr:phosphoribosylformylglycinamidine synthase [Phycisphaerales bacterium]